MEAKVSVIVAVYKTGQYLRQCLDSLIHQTYRNLEILVIDDGSPDDGGAIADEFARLDPRVLVTHKKNAGESAAYNDGIRQATGDWISTVDSDDWVSPDFFENLLKSPKADEMDSITSIGFYEEYATEQLIRYFFDAPADFYNGEGNDLMLSKVLLSFGKRYAFTLPRLYRKSLIDSEGLRFDESIVAGMPLDVLFNLEYFKKTKNVQIVDYVGYHYRVGIGGTMRYRPGRAQDLVYVFDRMQDVLSDCMTEKYSRMLDARILEDVWANLSRDYFHPDNKNDYRTVARGVKEMEQTEPYKRVIHQKNNEYMPRKAGVFKFALRLPWVWPLKVMFSLNEKLKQVTHH